MRAGATGCRRIRCRRPDRDERGPKSAKSLLARPESKAGNISSNPRIANQRIAQQISKAFGVPIEKDVECGILAKNYGPDHPRGPDSPNSRAYYNGARVHVSPDGITPANYEFAPRGCDSSRQVEGTIESRSDNEKFRLPTTCRDVGMR